jgi:hypothetical protein
MPTPTEAANRWIVGVSVAAAACVLALQLLVPPVVGLADNGDYHRVMGYAGFEHSTDDYGDRYFSFLRTKYRILPIGWLRSGYLSSETALALAARFAGPALWRGGLFDLRVLGAIHAALLLIALAAMLRVCRELPVPAKATAATLAVFSSRTSVMRRLSIPSTARRRPCSSCSFSRRRRRRRSAGDGWRAPC